MGKVKMQIKKKKLSNEFKKSVESFQMGYTKLSEKMWRPFLVYYWIKNFQDNYEFYYSARLQNYSMTPKISLENTKSCGTEKVEI